MQFLSLAVVGADHPNKSGPTRRFEIAMCHPGEPVALRHEPKNPADSNAIAVYSARDIQIGYIRAERAPLILLAMGRAGVTAIFQQKEKWGATIRAHLDGSDPVLPPIAATRPADRSYFGPEDDGWWPDEIWPDE